MQAVGYANRRPNADGMTSHFVGKVNAPLGSGWRAAVGETLARYPADDQPGSRSRSTNGGRVTVHDDGDRRPRIANGRRPQQESAAVRADRVTRGKRR